MAQKRRVLGTLSEAGQDAAQLLKSPEARQRIETDTEELTQRWDDLVQRLEDCSNQVTHTTCSHASVIFPRSTAVGI